MTDRRGIFNQFAYVYSLIRKKHPKWSHGQIKHCTVYALGYKKKEKENEKM